MLNFLKAMLDHFVIVNVYFVVLKQSSLQNKLEDQLKERLGSWGHLFNLQIGTIS
jgi:hypothetical protein